MHVAATDVVYSFPGQIASLSTSRVVDAATSNNLSKFASLA